MGDVHPEGDPHIHLDPARVPVIVDALADRIITLVPSRENGIRLRQRQWHVRWKLETAGWRQAAENLEGLSVAVQHSTFGYLLRWLLTPLGASLLMALSLVPLGLGLSVSHDIPAGPAAALLVIACSLIAIFKIPNTKIHNRKCDETFPDN